MGRLIPTFNSPRGVNARRSTPRASVTRKDFTDRLGLPPTATNEQLFAAVDAVTAGKRPGGQQDTVGTRTVAQDALYRKAWG